MAEISRWANTQATAEVACPRCGMQAGVECRTPKMRRLFTIHTERGNAYFAKIGRDEWLRRYSISKH